MGHCIGKIGGVQVRLQGVEVVVVEDVEPFGAEFQLESLRELEGLGDSCVEIPSAGTAEHVPARHVGGKRTEVRDAQHWIERRLVSRWQRQNSVLVRRDLYWTMRIEARYRSGRYKAGNAISNARIERVGGIEYREWRPRPGNKDAHDCPAAHRLAFPAPSALIKRKFIDWCHHHAMANVEIRTSPVKARIPGIQVSKVSDAIRGSLRAI